MIMIATIVTAAGGPKSWKTRSSGTSAIGGIILIMIAGTTLGAATTRRIGSTPTQQQQLGKGKGKGKRMGQRLRAVAAAAPLSGLHLHFRIPLCRGREC